MKKHSNIRGSERGTLISVMLVFLMVISAVPVMAGQDAGTEPATAPPVTPSASAAPGNSVNTVTIQPNAIVGKDNWIGNNPGFNTTNYGIDTKLAVGNWNANSYRSLVQFDVPSPMATLNSATLSMFCNFATGTSTNTSLYALTSAWEEGNKNAAVGVSSWEDRITNPVTLINENFEGTFPPAGWSVVDNAGNGGQWNRNDAFGVVNRCSGTSSGYSAAAEAYTSGIAWDTELRSPTLDITNIMVANLSFESNFQDFAGNGDAWVDVSADGGVTWTNEWYWSSDHGPFFEFIDLSGYVGNSIILRWRYACTSSTSWYWHIDNVQVQGISGVPWNTPGGDFNNSIKSNIEVGQANAWYSWDVTQIVQNWMDGTWANDGFILMPDFNYPGSNWVEFVSSDDTVNSKLAPKLTITYGAEIVNPVPAQNFNEDDPARNIDLSGRGSGSIVHQAGPCVFLTGFPFGAAAQLHYQSVYTPAQVGGEGVIRRISINRSTLNVPVFNNLKISLAHTTLDNLTGQFNSNYQGKLIEVLNEITYVANSSNSDTWVNFDLNDNFTYDSAYNLLVDIQHTGNTGASASSYVSNDIGIKRVYSTDGNITNTTNQFRPAFRFTTDVSNNAVVDSGMTGTFWPFDPTPTTEEHCQFLYNQTMINHAGIIDKIYFQSVETLPTTVQMDNMVIRMAHSTNDTLGTVFDAHNSDSWVTVLNVASLTLDSGYGPKWLEIDIDNSFQYNGVDNLLIDMSWVGGSSTVGDMDVGMFFGWSYNGLLRSTNTSSTTGTQWARLYNMEFEFQNSDNLTWSASSSDIGLFTAAAIGNSLRITPMPDANGVGTAYLTLHNSDGQTVTQAIPVIVNPVNDAPFFSSVPGPVQCTEDVNFTLNVTANVLDIDNDLANLTFSTDSAYATTTGGPEIVFNYPEGITSDFVNITVRDPSGLTGTAMVTVTITPVNDMPEFTGYVNTLVCDATVSRTYNVHPADEETATGQLLVYTSSQYAAVNNHTITFLYPKGIGSETVNIYLVDESIYGTQNNRTYSLAVTVNDHPGVTAHSPNGTGLPVTTTITVTFDMAMNHTKTENAFTMSLGTDEINGTFSWNAANTTMTFTPSHALTNGLYNVSVGASAESQTGFGMLNGYDWNFTAALGNYDGDGDGMPDQYELDHGLDPKLNDAQSDLDGDGMPNIYEYRNNLDPAVNDALADADGDGATNIDEYNAGTDPNNPNDSPAKPLGIIPILLILAVIVAIIVIVLVVKRRGQNPPPPDGWQEPGQEEPPLEQGTQEPYAQEPPPPPPPTGELPPEYPVDGQ